MYIYQVLSRSQHTYMGYLCVATGYLVGKDGANTEQRLPPSRVELGLRTGQSRGHVPTWQLVRCTVFLKVLSLAKPVSCCVYVSNNSAWLLDLCQEVVVSSDNIRAQNQV